VNERAVAALLGEPLVKADADFVRHRTGFVIGGVAPVGHREPPVTYLDEDLMQYAEIWAAAGTPNALFKLTPQDLLALTGAHVAQVKTSA
jgi:prolyl-tRNA editing enzyme YbaK/EbsC (Cys-tRNA(Pro) deacylase)